MSLTDLNTDLHEGFLKIFHTYSMNISHWWCGKIIIYHKIHSFEVNSAAHEFSCYKNPDLSKQQQQQQQNDATELKLFGANSFKSNPLHPNISMHNLHTVLHKHPVVLSRRICLMIKSLSSKWSFPFFSWPKCVIQGMIL